VGGRRHPLRPVPLSLPPGGFIFARSVETQTVWLKYLTNGKKCGVLVQNKRSGGGSLQNVFEWNPSILLANHMQTEEESRRGAGSPPVGSLLVRGLLYVLGEPDLRWTTHP
jgi:hypothetical protein